MNDIESRAAATPLRTIPPQWRTRVLARAAAAAQPAPVPWWRATFWPHPVAWAAVAACWIVAAALCWSGPRGSALHSFTPPGFPSLNVSPEQYVDYLHRCKWLMTQRETERALGRRPAAIQPPG